MGREFRVVRFLYSPVAIPRSHIFDGVTVSETAAFQLCDIEDAMLKEMIEDDDDLRETCHVRFASSLARRRLLTYLIVFLGEGWLVHKLPIRPNQDDTTSQVLRIARRPRSNPRGV